MILAEPNKKTEFLISKEKQAFNRIQLHFAILSEAYVKISPEQLFSAIKTVLNNCNIPSTHKRYIIEKLDIKNFSDKAELINLLEDKFVNYKGINDSITPSYVVGGVLRAIMVLLNYSEVNDINFLKNINQILEPCFKEYDDYVKRNEKLAE